MRVAMFPLMLENGAAVRRLRELRNAVVCTMAEPWALVELDVPAPLQVLEAGSVELEHLRALVETVDPAAEIAVGLGGGSSIDTAKFVAESRGIPLVQIPSIISVDAAFTPSYGYRDGSRVRYGGDVRPVEVIADPALIRKAPPALNRAGIGDLLSCHTALFDWKLAPDRGRGTPWDERTAAVGRSVLDEVESALPEIAAVSDEGVRALARIHQLVGATCVEAGHPLFEEGSEHFLAYTFEWLTGEHRVHGELISFSVLVMSFVQDNDPERASRIVRGSRVDARPTHLGIDDGLLERIFAELPGYCEREDLYASVIEVTELTADLAHAAMRHVLEVTDGPS